MEVSSQHAGHDDAERTHPVGKLLHELFEHQAGRTPEAIAVEYEGQWLTYGELNRRANQLARYLVNQGVGPDKVVGICVERSLEMVVGLLGILKAGGAYLPLDPNYPTERLQYMLEDAAPQAVLTQEELRNVLPDTAAEVIPLDTVLRRIAGYIDVDLPAAGLGLAAQNLLYVIYTSGSTGRPKGTAMPHESMVNLIQWHRESFGSGEGRRVLQFAALSFDVAFQETFSTLCSGGTLVLLNEWIRRDARALLEFLDGHRIERLFVPPLMLQSLAECAQSSGEVPQSLRDVITAGEQLRVSAEVVSLFKRLEGCRLHNHYGPTETHVVTALTLEGDPQAWPSLPTIGRPIANTQIYILDARGEPVPVGVAGEIYIAGANVARGYLGRPELTTQRFVTPPSSTAPRVRMYKTGDLGRWRADGTIEYLGRNDDQVKIRGYRIELGEIEAQLATHAQVREAVVVAREDEPGAKRLVAYVVLRDSVGTGVAPSVEELRAHVKGALPEYMVPSAFVILERMPLTPNGKLDRRGLPAPEQGAYVSREYEAPQGEVEEILAGIWQSLLKVERVGRRDNFFELGGHSLLIVQMRERLRRVGLSAEACDVYQNPTLAGTASNLKAGLPTAEVPPNLIPSGCKAITPQMLPLVKLEPEHIERIVRTVPGGAANIQDIYPLAPLQEGILFHHLLNERRGDTYVLPTLLSFESNLKVKQFTAALQAVIDRHDVLRTAVLWDQLPQPVQVVHRKAILPIETLTLQEGRDPLEELKQRMAPDRQRLDVCRSPLMRLCVARDRTSDKWYALLQLHHLVCDHESLETMLGEVNLLLGDDSRALPKPVPYRTHVYQALTHSREYDADKFFREKLADVSETTAPYGLLNVYGDASNIVEAHSSLDASLAEQVRSVARNNGVTAATLFHAAWALVVACTSAREDVVFGTLLLGRLQGDTEAQRSLGMFINALPLRMRLEGMTAQGFIQHTHCELAGLLNYEQASLASAQRCSGVARSNPLFTTLLNYLHGIATPNSERLISAAGVRVLAIREWTNYPITISVTDEGHGFELTAQTDSRIDPKRQLAYLVAATQSLLLALRRAPETLVASLSVLPDEERLQVTRSFNATETPYPRGKLVNELFEDQVRRSPAAIAVTSNDHSMTYAEMNARANQLARYLIEQGVQGGDYVAFLIARSIQALVAQLAVLKIGAAYVPIDPQLPFERQAFIVRDCGARTVLCDQPHHTSPNPVPESVRWIDCSEALTSAASLPATDLARELNAERTAAYVMYTSGSTGTPKGVVVQHSAINRLVINNAYAEIHDTDCIAHYSNSAFDASTFEIWGALLSGARLLIVPNSVVLDAGRFRALLLQEKVTILWMTTGLFTQYTTDLADAFARLRYLLIGGEVVRPEVVRETLRRRAPQHLLNAYGPTECTTFSTTYVIREVETDSAAIPIGKPISNARVYILNPRMQPVPIGVVGEIYIGGAGVALEYLNRPDLTAERFLIDPFGPDAAARIYRTGDRGRWRADGNIEFLGRSDNQVKIRGFRIELGDIEAQLSKCTPVKDAAVVVREDSPGDKRLIAYITKHDGGDLKADELRAQLSRSLPEYMIPAAFVILDKLPINANGKVDRHALPLPQSNAYARSAYEPPRGDAEYRVARVYEELLKVDSVGREDNFFDLGGHSLLAMQAAVRIRSAFAMEVPVSALFECPTVAQLSLRIEEIRQSSVRERLTGGGSEIQELLERVASMPEQEVQKLIRELRTGTTP